MKDPMTMTAEECVVELTADGWAIDYLSPDGSGDGFDASMFKPERGTRASVSATGSAVNGLRGLVLEARAG